MTTRSQRTMLALSFVLALLPLALGDDRGPVPLAGTGLIQAAREVTVSAEATGPIVQLKVKEGDHVQPGDLLAVIDDRQARLKLEAARAELESLRIALKKQEAGPRAQELAQRRTELDKADLSCKQAERDCEHDRKLAPQGAVSPQQLALSESRLELARRDLELARLRLELTAAGNREEDIEAARVRIKEQEIQVKLAELSLDQTRILAPGAGEIEKLEPQEGEWVKPGNPVAVILDLHTLHVDLDLPLAALPHVSVGLLAQVKTKLYEDTREGRVIFISPRVDSASETFLLRVAIENADHRFKPGMFAQVTIQPAP